jgi:hypothetical protein
MCNQNLFRELKSSAPHLIIKSVDQTKSRESIVFGKRLGGSSNNGQSHVLNMHSSADEVMLVRSSAELVTTSNVRSVVGRPRSATEDCAAVVCSSQTSMITDSNRTSL